MPDHLLENEIISIKIKDQGAELCSLFNKHARLEFLWQAGAAWPKHAPVLFPIVGQLKNNTYLYEGKTFHLERHGFARNKKFAVNDKGDEYIQFLLKEDKETLSQYPFSFNLFIRYSISGNNLTVLYEVINSGNSILPFSIGAHPAFKVPFFEIEKYEDYLLRFEKKELLERHLLQNGLLNGRKKLQLNNEDQLRLSRELFREDALVFKNMRSEKISIMPTNQANDEHHAVSMHFSNFPYLGIWAARDADFVCLEPWHGIADHQDHDQRIENKEGITLLEPGKKFHCSYAIQTR